MKNNYKYFNINIILIIIYIILSPSGCKKKSEENNVLDKGISKNKGVKIEDANSNRIEEKENFNDNNEANNLDKQSVIVPLLIPQDSIVRQLIEKYNQPDTLSKSDIINELIKINSEESIRGVFHLAQGMPPGELKVEICQKILEINAFGKEEFLIGALPTLDRETARSVSQVLGLHANHDLLEKITLKYDNESNSKNKALLLSVIENSIVPDAVQPLASLISNPNSRIDDELIYSSAKALAKNGSAPSISALLSKINSAKGKHEIEQLDNIISNIYESESEQALIYGALGNKDTSNTQGRIAAIKALANYQTQQSRDALQSLTMDTNPEIRRCSQHYLKKL